MKNFQNHRITNKKMEEDNFDDEKKLLEIKIEHDPDIRENKKSKSWSFAIMWFQERIS